MSTSKIDRQLFDASICDDAEALQIAIDAGANLDFIGGGSTGRTALIAACMFGCESAVDILIRAGADIDKTSDSGLTPLICAAINGHAGCVKLLAEGGADLDFSTDGGWTALMYSCRENFSSCADALVAAGANMNLRNGHGASAAKLAFVNGHVECLTLLGQAGAEMPDLVESVWDISVWGANSIVERKFVALGVLVSFCDRPYLIKTANDIRASSCANTKTVRPFTMRACAMIEAAALSAPAWDHAPAASAHI